MPGWAAELLQANRRAFKAAQLWQAAGKLEEAAKQYQAAGRWLRAAEMWGALDRLPEWAKALQRHAESLTNQPVSDEDRAQAWEVAAEAWDSLEEAEAVDDCQAQVACYRHLPYLEIAVQHETLRLNYWTKLRFVIKNVGYSTARFLIIQVEKDQFEGQVAQTRQIDNLKVKAQKADWLDVRPLALGDVPLRVRIEYQDEQGQVQRWSRTLYLPVEAA